ncbi:uncharacterized protein HKW66_Vig0237040 [Vigna angularis]|uniref:Uncharacterized protein n=1 Tax=Phaseolus angularis TaxID=3914 RepID=A0A8T0KR94_PHAAN|nr:uncharacterized protein HKW66_Vig0237040 [Vigna angularis]
MSSDFSGDEGRGYADNDNASPSSSSLAVFSGPGARASPSGNSSDLLVDSDAPDEVAIYVDSTGAWDGKPRAWPPVSGYDWVPHEPHPSKPWVSFRMVGNKHLLTLYNSSYKDFKNHFFKVVPTETGYQSFCTPTREAKFPFYWTRDPRKVLSWPKPQMAPEDLDLINQLCQLPPKSSCCVLIGFLGNKNLPSNVFDYLSKMDPSKNSTFARLFAQRGGDCHRFPFLCLRSRLWPIPLLLPSPPPKKKGKRKVARETSAESKHAKRSLPDGPPLPSFLSPNSWVAKHLHFDHFAEDKALVSGMTEEEASNMSMELTARAALCQAYAAHKKASASAELQALQAKLESSIKANQDLTLQLAETERMAEEDKKKASTLLAEGRASQRRTQRSLDDAQLDLQKAIASNTTLMAERDSLLDRVTKLEAEVKLLGDEVVNEHVLDFDKALAQCHLLFQVPTDDPRLDVSMMVVDNQLVPISVPPSSPPIGQTVDAAVEVLFLFTCIFLFRFFAHSLFVCCSVCPVRVSLDLGFRSSLEACPKTKVRIHERILPHPLGLGLRSSLEACPKTKVRVHKRNLPHPLGLGLRSSIEACPKTKVRVHKRNLPHPLGC